MGSPAAGIYARDGLAWPAGALMRVPSKKLEVTVTYSDCTCGLL